VPVLDAVVSRSTDRRKIVLKLVNTDLTQDLSLDVRVRGAAVRTRAERVVLTAASLMARTSFRAHDALRPERDSIEAGKAFALRLPKHSVTVIALEVAEGVQ
jgi:alpha-L-arabinofuranosidase